MINLKYIFNHFFSLTSLIHCINQSYEFFLQIFLYRPLAFHSQYYWPQFMSSCLPSIITISPFSSPTIHYFTGMRIIFINHQLKHVAQFLKNQQYSTVKNAFKIVHFHLDILSVSSGISVLMDLLFVFLCYGLTVHVSVHPANLYVEILMVFGSETFGS